MAVTPEQEAEIEAMYGFRIGSRVVWKEAEFAKRRIPRDLAALRRRDGVGIIEEFSLWKDSVPTARIRFPDRPQLESMNQGYDVTWIDMLSPAPTSSDSSPLGKGEA